MHKFVASILAAALALAPFCAANIRAADAPAAPAGNNSIMGGSGPLKDELDPDTRKRVDRGLAWLAKNLNDNGAINAGGGESVAIIALAGLAFLADGSMPNDGRYGKEVDKILTFVLKSCQDSGLIASENMGSPMYGHGFATLFLAEAYGMSPRADVKEKLQNAIRLIVQSQNNEGGWRYQPVPQDADLSVTICQVMALRAARNAGIKIPAATIDNAIKYVKNTQEPDGGFSYMIGSRGSGYPRSAAGTACLFYLRSGDQFEKELKSAEAYLMKQLPGKSQNEGEYHYFYGNYYGTQAMFMAGGEFWKAYWPAIRADLAKRQTEDGSWTGESGQVYATAMALIMLQVPNRLLPILQK